MTMHAIDHVQYIDEIHQLLEHTPHEESSVKGGKIFTVRTKSPQTLTTITITPSWVGYEFVVKEDVFDKTAGYWNDTDNYPLDFDPEVTHKVYGELKFFLGNLLGHKIFWGTTNGVPTLARPLPSGEYEVCIYHKTNTFQLDKTEYQTVAAPELEARFSLKPIAQ